MEEYQLNLNNQRDLNYYSNLLEENFYFDLGEITKKYYDELEY